MAFTPKTWQDAPSTATPIDAAALMDMETRLANYADLLVGQGVPVKGDPTGATDSTTAFRAAWTESLAEGTHMLVPPGTYTTNGGAIHSAGQVQSPVRIAAMIPGTVTIQRTATGPFIEVVGSRTSTVALTADAALGTTTLTVATLPSGLVVEDYIEISSNVLFATGVGSSTATYAEMAQVKTITGTGPYTITLYGPTEEAYTTANSAAIAKLNLAGAGSFVHGIKFRQTATGRDSVVDPFMRFALCKDVTISNTSCFDGDSPGIEIRGVLNADIDKYRAENLQVTAGYGVSIGGNCRNIRISRMVASKVRHAVSTTWGTFTAGTALGANDVGVPRHIIVANSQSYGTFANGWNTHKEGKYITFLNCESHNDSNYGFYIRNPHTTIVNPTVVNPGSGTTHAAIKIAENEASDCVVEGGRLVLGPNSFSGLHIESARFYANGTRIYGPAGNGANITIEASGVDCVFDNVYSSAPNGHHYRTTSGSATGLIVRNPICVGGTTKYITSLTTAGQGRIIGQASAGNNLFGMDQNARALTDFQNTIRNVSTSTTINDIDGTIYVTTGASALTESLPTPSAAFVGKEFRIVKADSGAGTVTIAATGGSTVFGSTVLSAQGSMAILTCNGTNWFADTESTAVRAITASGALLPTDSVVTVDPTSGAITIDLPTAVGNTGITYNIKRITGGANAVVIDPNSTQTIDGSTTLNIMGLNDSYTIVSTGANWIII